MVATRRRANGLPSTTNKQRKRKTKTKVLKKKKVTVQKKINGIEKKHTLVNIRLTDEVEKELVTPRLGCAVSGLKKFRGKRSSQVLRYRRRCAINRKIFLKYNEGLITPFLKSNAKIFKLFNTIEHTPILPARPYITDTPAYVKFGKLRDYQIAGINWIIHKFDSGVGCILGDEMGLGKTIETLSFLAYLKHERKLSGPNLIIVPLSVSLNWVRESKRWTPSLTWFKVHGGKAERDDILSRWDVVLGTFDLIITTFETVLAEFEYFKSVKWLTISIDEAHRLKGSTSQIHLHILKLKCPFQLLITGTPLQNNLHELGCLFKYILPDSEIGLDPKKFLNSFVIDSQQFDTKMLNTASKLLSSLMIRRTKAEVEPDLPTKTEIPVFIPLNEIQNKWYTRLINKDTLLEGFLSYHQIMAMIMQLRKVCNHPSMLTYKTTSTRAAERRQLYEKELARKRQKHNHGYKEWSSDDDDDDDDGKEKSVKEIPRKIVKVNDPSGMYILQTADYPGEPTKCKLEYGVAVVYTDTKKVTINLINTNHTDQTNHTDHTSEIKTKEGEVEHINDTKIVTINHTNHTDRTHHDEIKTKGADHKNDPNTVTINHTDNTNHDEIKTKEGVEHKSGTKTITVNHTNHINQNNLTNNTNHNEIKTKGVENRNDTKAETINPTDHLGHINQTGEITEDNGVDNTNEIVITFYKLADGSGWVHNYNPKDPSGMDRVLEDEPGTEELERRFAEMKRQNEQRKLLKGTEYEELLCDSLEKLLEISNKMLVFHKLVRHLRKEGHRVLVFSQFTIMLDVLQKYVELQGWMYKRLDGSTNRILRELDIRDFNAPGSPFFIYLISTRAGGLGVNLASANTVIIYDSDWNPQNDLQAIARVHRIGQKRKVTIYRLISEDTVEERMVQRAQQKLCLDRMVVGNPDSKSTNNKMTVKEMMAMLTFGSQVRGKGTDLSHLNLEEILKRSDLRVQAYSAQKEAISGPNSPYSDGGHDDQTPKIVRHASGLLKQQKKAELGKKDMTCNNCQKINLMEINQLNCRFCRYPMREAKNKFPKSPTKNIFKINPDLDRAGRKRKRCSVFIPDDWRIDESLKKPKLKHEDRCFLCNDGGILITCVGCPKVYHKECVGLSKIPKGSWYCPWHECRICGKRNARVGGIMFRCIRCPIGYCFDHWPEQCPRYKKEEPAVSSLIKKLNYRNYNPRGVEYCLCAECIAEDEAKDKAKQEKIMAKIMEQEEKEARKEEILRKRQEREDQKRIRKEERVKFLEERRRIREEMEIEKKRLRAEREAQRLVERQRKEEEKKRLQAKREAHRLAERQRKEEEKKRLRADREAQRLAERQRKEKEKQRLREERREKEKRDRENRVREYLAEKLEKPPTHEQIIEEIARQEKRKIEMKKKEQMKKEEEEKQMKENVMKKLQEKFQREPTPEEFELGIQEAIKQKQKDRMDYLYALRKEKQKFYLKVLDDLQVKLGRRAKPTQEQIDQAMKQARKERSNQRLRELNRIRAEKKKKERKELEKKEEKMKEKRKPKLKRVQKILEYMQANSEKENVDFNVLRKNASWLADTYHLALTVNSTESPEFVSWIQCINKYKDFLLEEKKARQIAREVAKKEKEEEKARQKKEKEEKARQKKEKKQKCDPKFLQTKIESISKKIDENKELIDLEMLRESLKLFPMEYHLPINLVMGSNEWNQWLTSFTIFRTWINKKEFWNKQNNEKKMANKMLKKMDEKNMDEKKGENVKGENTNEQKKK